MSVPVSVPVAVSVSVPVSVSVFCQACGNGGRWERAVQLLADMEDDGSTPETPSYKAVLEILRDAGQWEKASERKYLHTRQNRV